MSRHVIINELQHTRLFTTACPQKSYPPAGYVSTMGFSGSNEERFKHITDAASAKNRAYEGA